MAICPTVLRKTTFAQVAAKANSPAATKTMGGTVRVAAGETAPVVDMEPVILTISPIPRFCNTNLFQA
jgi:hypothetical protein